MPAANNSLIITVELGSTAPHAIKAQFRKDVCVCGRRTCPWHNDMRIVPRNNPWQNGIRLY